MMDNIRIQISKLIDPEYKIIVQSNAVQNLLTADNTVLWNNEPSKITDKIYLEFKDAIKNRGSKHYTKNDTLSYPDFCIALLCSSEYSLNNKTLPSLQDRTFIAAWRGLNVVSTTASSDVCSWIDKYITNRTAEGYESTHGVLENKILYSSKLSPISSRDRKVSKDIEILENLTFSEHIVDLSQNEFIKKYFVLHDTACTPESELDILNNIFEVMSYDLL